MTQQNCYALDFAGTDYPPKVFPSLCESSKLFRNDFYGEISKNYPFDKKQAFLTKILSKRFNSLNCLLKNKKYGETAQKLKVG